MITAAQKKRVAGACMPDGKWENVPDSKIAPVLSVEWGIHWMPSVHLDQKDALVQKVAELVDADYQKHDLEYRHVGHLKKLNEALATNDTNAIEQLCFELIEGVSV